MDVSTKSGSAHGCAVRTGALKRDLFSKIKKRLGTALFGYSFLAVEKHGSLELRNCVSVSHRLHAVKGGRPTKKVKPCATSESPQTNQISYEVLRFWRI